MELSKEYEQEAMRFAETFPTLTPAERSETARIVCGFDCSGSAQKAGVSKETVRARRKRIYRKTNTPGSNSLVVGFALWLHKRLPKAS